MVLQDLCGIETSLESITGVGQFLDTDTLWTRDRHSNPKHPFLSQRFWFGHLGDTLKNALELRRHSQDTSGVLNEIVNTLVKA